MKGETVMKIMLGEVDIEYHSFKGARPSAKEIRRALELVAECLPACWAAWRKHSQ